MKKSKSKKPSQAQIEEERKKAEEQARLAREEVEREKEEKNYQEFVQQPKCQLQIA
jgi:hypothetical protein